MSSIFGTNGVRGVVNEDLTIEFASKLGRALGRFYKDTVALTMDTRESSDMIKCALESGILSVGCNVVDLGILPIPALQYYVGNHVHVSGGVMVTASHNAAEYNGIKCIDGNGHEILEEQEDAIQQLFVDDAPIIDPNGVGAVYEDDGVADTYVDAVLKTVDVQSIKRKHMKVVVDCANGASSVVVPLLLQKLGVTAVTMNATIGGSLPGRLSEPDRENLNDIVSLMAVVSADLGVGLDIDGDRAVFISDNGVYLGGDRGMAVLARYLLSKKPGATVVTPLTSSSVISDVVEAAGGTIKYCGVGSPLVAKAMMDENAIFGGEENGGLMFQSMNYARDPTAAIAKLLECIANVGTLDELIADLPLYHVVKDFVDCPDDKKKTVHDAIRYRYRESRTIELDGTKIFFDDGWVFVRPSGTENKIRIFSESKSEETAKTRAEQFRKELEELLSV